MLVSKFLDFWEDDQFFSFIIYCKLSLAIDLIFIYLYVCVCVCVCISYILNGKSYTMWSEAYLYIKSVCMTKFFTPSMNINFEQHHQNSIKMFHP